MTNEIKKIPSTPDESQKSIFELERIARERIEQLHNNFLRNSNLKSGDEIQPPKKNEPSYKKRRKGF